MKTVLLSICRKYMYVLLLLVLVEALQLRTNS